jgi:4-hydroxybenzoate polyprenyltransferase
VALTAALLAYEHALVGKGDLRKIDKAFFDVNAWVSVVFFALVALDAVLR